MIDRLRAPRASTAASRAVGATALLCAAVAPLLVALRADVPRPRWDVVAVIAAALLLGLLRAALTRSEPAAGEAGAPPHRRPIAPPALPLRLPLPRPLRRAAVGTVLVVLLGWGLVAAVALPRGAEQARLREIHAAGSSLVTGQVSAGPTDVTRLGGTPARYRATLVMTVADAGGRPVRITVLGTGLGAPPRIGDRHQVLLARSHPELGGIVDEAAWRLRLTSGWYLSVHPGVALLALLLLLVLVPYAAAGRSAHAKARVLLRDARGGEVLGVRVTPQAAVREESVRPVPVRGGSAVTVRSYLRGLRGASPVTVRTSLSTSLSTSLGTSLGAVLRMLRGGSGARVRSYLRGLRGASPVTVREYLRVLRADGAGAELFLDPADDAPALVARFAGGQEAWLLAPRHWRLLTGRCPVVLVTDAGVCHWGEFESPEAVRAFFGDGNSRRTTAPVRPRPAAGTGNAGALLLPVGLGALAVAPVLPLLLTDGPGTAPAVALCLLSALLGLLVAPLRGRLLGRQRAARPWTVVTTAQQPSLDSAQPRSTADSSGTSDSPEGAVTRVPG
ncbi:hypothetical protein [Kitasatospora sp. NBC_00315]|uniref:hypothetical protein n=1 Tax=Kitasatospora sp. NBC_00315 TaxID=2975963 RepID=UPI0032507C48